MAPPVRSLIRWLLWRQGRPNVQARIDSRRLSLSTQFPRGQELTRKKTPNQLDFAPRLSFYSVGKRMKNSCSARLGWLVFPCLWIFHSAAVAQEDIHGSPLTNSIQSQTNTFQPQPVNPTLSDNGRAVVAQEDIYTNALANKTQAQTNGFQPSPVGPTAPGTGQLGAPYMGISSLAGSTIAQAPYVPTGFPPGAIGAGGCLSASPLFVSLRQRY